VINGGFGSAILEFAAAHNYKNVVIVKGIPDAFIEHGSVEHLHKALNIDTASLRDYIQSKL
jgi:1-deoxy-D-xylulose-5-phosphate synthase